MSQVWTKIDDLFQNRCQLLESSRHLHRTWSFWVDTSASEKRPCFSASFTNPSRSRELYIYIYINNVLHIYIYSFISLQIGQCRCDLTEHLWNKMGKLEWPMQVEQGTGIRSLESFIPRSAPWLNWSQRNVEISYHSTMVSWGCLICLHTKN